VRPPRRSTSPVSVQLVGERTLKTIGPQSKTVMRTDTDPLMADRTATSATEPDDALGNDERAGARQQVSSIVRNCKPIGRQGCVWPLWWASMMPSTSVGGLEVSGGLAIQ
jgi:hypothetical protein